MHFVFTFCGHQRLWSPRVRFNENCLMFDSINFTAVFKRSRLNGRTVGGDKSSFYDLLWPTFV